MNRLASALTLAAALALGTTGCAERCGPTSCAGCCTTKGECVLAASAVSCGASGDQCTTCVPGQVCLSGLCTFTSSGGGGGSGGGAGGGAGGGSQGGGGGWDAGPQPGCTLQNCRTMIDACRVEIIGGPARSCAAYLPAPAGWDYASYCVTACTELGYGEEVVCLASKAPVCLAARDAGTFPDAELNGCFDGGVAEATCEASCNTARAACDELCYPRACDSCYRAGMTNCPCPDAGFAQCMDCSSACNRQYGHCIAACPRG